MPPEQPKEEAAALSRPREEEHQKEARIHWTWKEVDPSYLSMNGNVNNQRHGHKNMQRSKVRICVTHYNRLDFHS